MTRIRPVILCGGAGTRLWPESREKIPKQFIPVINQKSLLDLTIERIKKIENFLKPIFITNEKYKFFVKDSLLNNNLKATMILEPIGKNTAPAIYIVSKLLNNKDNLIILPSDHYIRKDDIFINSLNRIFEQQDTMEKNWITLGITPSAPSTSYGYIKLDKKTTNINNLFSVAQFVEKPNFEDANKFIKTGSYFWNAGIFIGNNQMILKSIQNCAPELADLCDLLVEGQCYYETKNEYNFNIKEFDKIPAQSIDVSVLEKCKNIYCYPIDCQWNDIGSWEKYFECFPINKKSKNIIQVNSKNNSIKADKRLIATVGVKDLIIVDKQDAVLVAKKGLGESIRDLIFTLNKKDYRELKENVFEKRPWGIYENLFLDKFFKIKQITVNPKSRLSKQFHNFRSEHWFVIQGTAFVFKDGKIIILKKGESVDIPKKCVHYIENKSKNKLKFIEIQMGTYFGEDDIIRIDDIYDRK